MTTMLLAIVSVVVLAVAPARADQAVQVDKALLAQAQQTGMRFYAAIDVGNMKTVQAYLLSHGEAKFYFRQLADPRAYNAYVGRTWQEVREMKANEQQHAAVGSAIAFAGFHFLSVVQTSGPNAVRPTLVITARPIYNVNGKRVLGGDVVRLVRVNNYWKIGSVLD